MTLFGKILVCLNLAFSLAMAAVALGIYTQRINWTNQPPETTPDQAAGELALRRAEITKHWRGLLTAEMRQQAALARLRGLEQQRPADLLWYARQLEHMEKTASDKDPVKDLIVQEGKVQLDATNRPALRDATDRAKQPLRSMEWYNNEIKDVYAQIVAEREKLDKIVQEDTELTMKVVGAKGLRQRIVDEEDKRIRVELELRDFVQPQLVNVHVESDLLLKRRNALLERIEELKKAPLRSEAP